MMARTKNPMDLSTILDSGTIEDYAQIHEARKGSCPSLAISSQDQYQSTLTGRSCYQAPSSFPPRPAKFSPFISDKNSALLLPTSFPTRDIQESFEKPQLPSTSSVFAPTLIGNTTLSNRQRAASPLSFREVKSRGNGRRHARAPVFASESAFQQITVTPQSNYHDQPSQLTYSSQKHYRYVATHPPSIFLGPATHIAHSNKVYSVEQVHFIRFHREDLNKKWPEVLSHYRANWPEDYFRESAQCFSARYYRDNWLPMVDSDFNLVLDGDGKVLVILDKVRSKFGAPTTMVDKHPEAVVKKEYAWVGYQYHSRAKQIRVDDVEATENGRLGYWGKWRKAVLDVEARFKSSSRHVIKRKEIITWERQLDVRFLLRPAEFEKIDGRLQEQRSRHTRSPLWPG